MRYFGTRHDTAQVTAARYDAQAKVFTRVLHGIAGLQEKVIQGNEFINKSYARMQVRCALLASVPGIGILATVAVSQYAANDQINSITNVLTPGFFQVAMPAAVALQAAGAVKAGVNYFKKGMVERKVATAEKQIIQALYDVQNASEQTGIPVDTWNLRRLIEEHTKNRVAINPTKVAERIVTDDQNVSLSV